MDLKLHQLMLRLFVVLLLPAALTACSDDDDDEPTIGNGEPEYLYGWSDNLRNVWKITEWEEAGKSFFTKDFATSWLICPERSSSMSYKLTKELEIKYISGVAVYDIDGRQYICESGDKITPIFEIESMTDGGNKKVMVIIDGRGNRYRCETVANPMVMFIENQTNYESLSIEYTEYESRLSGSTYAERDLEYIVKALPRGNYIDMYYCVLVEPFSANSRYENLVRCEVTTPDRETLKLEYGLDYGYNRGILYDSDFTGIPNN